MIAVDFQTLTDGFRSLLAGSMLPVVVAAAALAFLLRGSFGRFGRVLSDVFFTNWRLSLLGATGIVLSLASGWTTWDGMKNFTGEPILSAMVTFGIQGVMLIVAWLIGESFATGMSQQTRNGIADAQRGEGDDTVVSLKTALILTLCGILTAMVAGTAHLLLNQTSLTNLPLWLAGAGGALMLLGLFLVAARANTLRGYFDATRVIVRTAVLWVMFLACMATSVFFSFDSLFSTIFPQEERKRAGELRAQNQVAGIVADIGAMIATHQLTESERLFESKSWKEYEDKNLAALARLSQGAEKEIEAYYVQQMENRRRGIAEQQERIATATGGQAGLAGKKGTLTDELSRLEGERPSLATDFNEKKTALDQRAKEIDAKRVEAMAEDKGVEGTGKVGKGPIYRQRLDEMTRLQDYLKIGEERVKDSQKRLAAVETRIAQIKRELSVVDGDLGKLKSEAATAEQRIKMAEEAKAGEEGSVRVDPARVRGAFETARVDFRQQPTVEHLAKLQNMCGQLYAGMASTPATKEKVRGIDCDPKQAAEASARVFALNDGIKAFAGNCSGGDRLAQLKSADALFEFSRKCVQDSGLASKDTDDLRQKINFIELNRDDKANRFVVTWNAFQDGNRLAYLSLAIAIAIDSLVFMSGLFGANAVRSPLSDLPTTKARSGDQLEGIIDNALLPNRFENARLAIEAMHADNSQPGYSAVVELSELDYEHAAVVRNVLNAGNSIGAVHRDPFKASRYFVRAELFEYLSLAGARAYERDGGQLKENIGEKVKLSQLEKDVSAALLPDEMPATPLQLNREIARNAQVILDHLHPYPVKEQPDFANEIRLDEIMSDVEKRIARRALTAGSSMGYVQNAEYKGQNDRNVQANRYVLHTGFVKTLTRLRAKMLLSTSSGAMQIGQSAIEGGALGGAGRYLDANAAHTQLPLPAPASVAPAERSARARTLDPETVPTTGAAASFERELVDHFANEMGQQTESIEYLAAHHKAIDAAGLWRALDQVIRNDEAGLRRPLLAAMKSLDAAIDDARGSFPSRLLAAPASAAQLNDLADKLKAMQPVMVMMAGGAYDHLINRMEIELSEDRAADRLDQAKVAKHKFLIEHRSDLARAKYAPDHWKAVEQALARFSHRLATLAGSDQRPTRMA